MMDISIDYLALSGGSQLLELVRRIVGTPRETRGRLGYAYGEEYDCPGVACYWGGLSQAGTYHVRISGNGCRALREHLTRLMSYGSATRLDIAVDGLAELDVMQNAVESGMVVGCGSTLKTVSSTIKGVFSKTTYAGARTSEKMVRVYAHDGVPRFELELKGQAARAAATMIRDFVSLADVVASMVDVRTQASNRARRQVVDWWKALGSCAEKWIREPVERTLGKTVRWIEKSVLPALKLIEFYFPGTTTRIALGYEHLLAEDDMMWLAPRGPGNKNNAKGYCYSESNCLQF